MNIFTSLFIRRNAAASHKQIILYLKKGLLNPNIIKDDNSVEMSLEDLDVLFKIKLLQKIGFNLDQIKIFLKLKASETELFKMFYEFVESEKNGYESLLGFLKNIEKDKIQLCEKEVFYFSNKTIIAPYVAIDVFKIKKTWYLEKEKKDSLRKWRKNFYSLFLNFEKNLDQIKPTIENELDELWLFFKFNTQFESMLGFFVFIHWLTMEPRYIKEMKRICKYNYSKEIMDLTITWFCQKY